jgi:hypothetical protein
MVRRALFACFMTLVSSPALAAACVQPEGMAIGPLVPTEEAARAMYKTIARIRHDPIKSSNNVVVNDKGDHWEVFQYPKHIDPPRTVNGTEIVSVVAGGGMLDLEIRKCDASTTGYYDR